MAEAVVPAQAEPRLEPVVVALLAVVVLLAASTEALVAGAASAEAVVAAPATSSAELVVAEVARALRMEVSQAAEMVEPVDLAVVQAGLLFWEVALAAMVAAGEQASDN